MVNKKAFKVGSHVMLQKFKEGQLRKEGVILKSLGKGVWEVQWIEPTDNPSITASSGLKTVCYSRSLTAYIAPVQEVTDDDDDDSEVNLEGELDDEAGSASEGHSTDADDIALADESEEALKAAKEKEQFLKKEKWAQESESLVGKVVSVPNKGGGRNALPVVTFPFNYVTPKTYFL